MSIGHVEAVAVEYYTNPYVPTYYYSNVKQTCHLEEQTPVRVYSSAYLDQSHQTVCYCHEAALDAKEPNLALGLEYASVA
jgi:hypothetical protein